MYLYIIYIFKVLYLQGIKLGLGVSDPHLIRKYETCKSVFSQDERNDIVKGFEAYVVKNNPYSCEKVHHTRLSLH